MKTHNTKTMLLYSKKRLNSLIFDENSIIGIAFRLFKERPVNTARTIYFLFQIINRIQQLNNLTIQQVVNYRHKSPCNYRHKSPFSMESPVNTGFMNFKQNWISENFNFSWIINFITIGIALHNYRDNSPLFKLKSLFSWVLLNSNCSLLKDKYQTEKKNLMNNKSRIIYGS